MLVKGAPVNDAEKPLSELADFCNSLYIEVMYTFLDIWHCYSSTAMNTIYDSEKNLIFKLSAASSF